MCSLSKKQLILSGETIQKTLFFRIISLFRLRLFILCQARHSRALAPACGALVILTFRNSNHRLMKNIEAKGEIARNEQFLLFPQCFSSYRIDKFFRISTTTEIFICKFFQFVAVQNLLLDKQVRKYCVNARKYWLLVFFSFSHNDFQKQSS